MVTAGPLLRLLRGVLGLGRLEAVYARRPPGRTGLDFADWAVEDLALHAEVAPDDLARIPAAGPAVLVANHPFGGAEGLVLAHLAGRRRRDVKIVANYMLGRMPELAAMAFLVDPFDVPRAPRRNVVPLRGALRFVERGGLLIVFPAGEVAHFDRTARGITDPPWSPLIGGLVRRARACVVPAWIAGRNGWGFQAAGLVHPRLRTALLPRALLARRGRPLEVRIGSPVPFRQIEVLASDTERMAYLRDRTYVLAERAPLQAAVQPRRTPATALPIVPAAPAELLAAEIGRLAPERLLVDAGGDAVYVAAAQEIPATLREIGRLREVTFRLVGEGTGREIDLDEFDRSYLHLLLWNRTERQVVGAYRLGPTDRLLADGGPEALYTSTLFGYDPRLFAAMGPALEMGRSFVRPEHQKSYAALLLLWRGIGQFVVRHPRYHTLFGPVSISADYRSASQRLLLSFLQQNRYVHEWRRWVRPRTPPRAERRRQRHDPAGLADLDDVSTFISEIESDHKGAPILLKQYLKLGGKLLGFNVDPAFSNVLDVLILVDLRRTDPKILARTMGPEGTARFLAHARGAAPAAG